jgi:hypothetical protein
MKKIIKITEAQLREADFEAFSYLDMNDDTKPFDGQCVISAQGKLDGEENGEPIFTDRIGKERTPQAWARYRMYGNINQAPHARTNNLDFSLLDDLSDGLEPIDDLDNELDEGVAFDTNFTDLGVKKISKDIASLGKDIDALSNNNINDNLCVVPKGIDQEVNIMIKKMKGYNLTPKQIAIIFDKFLESFPQIAQNANFVKDTLRQEIDPNTHKDFNN